MKPRLLPPAELEMLEAAMFYESQVSQLGVQFLDQIDAALVSILQHPNVGTLIRSGIRKRRVHRFPYSLLYRIDPDEIVILAVAHQHRRPDYWVDRS